MGTSGLESCLKSTAHHTSSISQEAIPHTIVVAVQLAKTFFENRRPAFSAPQSLELATKKMTSFPLFRVAYIEAQLALIF